MLKILKAIGSHPQTQAKVISPRQMSKIYRSGPSWKGFPSLRANLYPSGDSYSDVGYSTFIRHVPAPSASNPLGIKFPGMTFNEKDLPNWVGHLIAKYSPAPRFDPSLVDEQDTRYTESPLLVYDYAIGGQTVDGVRLQIENMFLPTFKKDTETSLNESNSLFITWIGINDCGGYADPHTAIEALIVGQELLYKAGARNFLFIDVPPIHRSPAIPKDDEEESSSRYLNWNVSLRERLETFSGSHKDASLFLFSSFEVFENVLNDPKSFGTGPKEVRKAGGALWVDHLHPTSKMHDIFASNLADFLHHI